MSISLKIQTLNDEASEDRVDDSMRESFAELEPPGEQPISQQSDERLQRRSTAGKRVMQYASASSIAIIGFITFVGDSARGLIYPALWPLCESLGGNKVDLGWLVATFSIGRLVISTYLGKLADKYRHKKTLILANGLLVIGAIIWANAPKLGGLYTLYAAQFIMGLGTGSLGVTRSYIVEQTPPEKRTYSLARLSALQYAGFSMTPLVGAALVVSGGRISSFWEYSLPAYLIVFEGLICIAVLIYPFLDVADDEETTDATTVALLQAVASKSPNMLPSSDHAIHNSVQRQHRQDYDAAGSYALLPSSHSDANPVKPADAENKVEPSDNAIVDRDKQSVYTLMMLLNFTTRGAIAVYEAQSSQIILQVFRLNEIELGTIITVAGTIGTIQLIFFKELWTKHFSDMTLTLGGIALMGLPQVLVIELGNLNQIDLWRFLLPLFLMYSIGYPVGNSGILGGFSMLQKKGRQSSAQGQFALMGSLARIVLPIISGYFEEYIEESSSFSIVLVMMAVSSIAIMHYYYKILHYTVGGIDKNTHINVFHYGVIFFYLGIMLLYICVIFDIGIL